MFMQPMIKLTANQTRERVLGKIRIYFCHGGEPAGIMFAHGNPVCPAIEPDNAALALLMTIPSCTCFKGMKKVLSQDLKGNFRLIIMDVYH